ncbi:MAG: rRNA maturation RNase YbeY [Rikenellaceae bacterium]|nr:rRNA maturation RNase YbeY [Rikenellaceae bacterium]
MINYFTEDCVFSFRNRRKINKWIKDTVSRENMVTGDISIIFSSDDYLLEVNKKFLNHDYYTDIITFDYCENKTLCGDLFISIDTVRSNSEKFNVSFDNELKRVIIHGILHLCGYGDKTEKEETLMREKENFYLSILEKEEK